MDETEAPRRPRRAVIVATCVAVIALVLIGVGVYGLIHGPGTDDPTGGPAPVPTVTAGSGRASATTGASPAAVAETSDPEAFAHRVATALFAWDTTQAWEPSDYMQALLDVGDPTGAETPGLASDLTLYYPTIAQWGELRGYQTRQWLTIATAAVPSSWGQAVEEAGTELRPGTTAYTITGTRHRAGVWDGKPVTTAEPVSFTIFETCQPTYKTCRLLRLSQLGNPLP